jgi:hypothetical protein
MVVPVSHANQHSRAHNQLDLDECPLGSGDCNASRGSTCSFDFVGFILLAFFLGLFNFAWNQAPITGWSESYVWAMLIVAAGFAAAFFLWAKYMGDKALIPIAVLQRSSLLVYLSLWLGWMSFGVFLFYTVNL